MRTLLMIPPARIEAACPPEERKDGIPVHWRPEREYKLRDFFAAHYPDYQASRPVSWHKQKVMDALIACKSGKLGYTLSFCEACGRTEMHSCACGNRNCPSCGRLKEKRWAALRQSEVIEGIPYYHLVFTLPHSLTGIIFQNQKIMLDLLFRSVKETVLDLSRDRLKMKPGILMVLHSFGSDLSLHYHIHMLVSGGGLTPDRTDFRKCPHDNYFLPVEIVSQVYRGKFLAGMKVLRDGNRLSFQGSQQKYRNSYEWKELLDSCYTVDWNVEMRPLVPDTDRPEGGKGPQTAEHALNYFARYVDRTAISDSRILEWNDKTIRFRYKEYDGSSYTMKTMELSAEEFIRRFLTHILPSGFQRIRSAGFLAGRNKKRDLALIHEILGRTYEESPLKDMKAKDLILFFFGRDITVCEKCHGPLVILPRMKGIDPSCFIRGA